MELKYGNEKFNEKGEWDLIIRPKKNWLDINFRELWEHRELVGLFVKRDFISRYKQTVLGPFWFVLNPLLSTLIYTLIFSAIAKIPTGGSPPVLFYLSGIVLWTYFSNCLVATSSTFLGNAAIFGKVYFPRLILPISVVISNLVQFLIQFGLFAIVLVIYSFKTNNLLVNGYALLIPLHIFILAAISLGFGIIVSSLTIKYRDLSNFMNVGIQLWMYATPVIYPMSAVSGGFKKILLLNPVAPIVEAFKFGLIGGGEFSLSHYMYSLAFACVILFLGIFLFNRVENNFMDTI
jgi:lipopolysaccharide transport system permease protein